MEDTTQKATYRGYTPAQAKANKAWESKQARINLRLSPELKESVQEHATARGESTMGFITRAITEAIAHDAQPKSPADQQPQPQQEAPQQPRPDGALVLMERGTVSPKLERVEHLYTDPNTGREYYVEPVISDTEWEDTQQAKAIGAEDTDDLPF